MFFFYKIRKFRTDPQNGTTFLSGTRNGKLWIAGFETESKEQNFEFVDKDDVALSDGITTLSKAIEVVAGEDVSVLERLKSDLQYIKFQI